MRNGALFVILLGLPGMVYGQGRTSSGTQAQSALQKADEAYAANKLKEALQLYQQALNYDRTLLDAYEKIAAIQYRLGGSAVGQLRSCLRVQPGHKMCTMWLGLHLLRKKQKAEGYRLLHEAIEKDWKLFLASVKLAGYYYRLGRKEKDPAKRKKYLRQAHHGFWTFFRFRPKGASSLDHAIHYRLGRIYLMQKRWPAAYSQFLWAMRKKKKWSYKYWFAEALLGRRYYWKALSTFRQLLDKAKKRPRIHLRLATCYYKIRRKGAALSHLKQYEALRPNRPAAMLLRGDIHFFFRDYEKAAKAFQQALRRDRNALPARIRYAESLLKLKRAKEAVQILRAAPGSPSDPDLLRALGEAHLALRQPAPAVSALNKLLAAEPKHAEALTLRGDAHLMGGKPATAINDYSLALKVQPRSGRAKRGLIRALNKRAHAQLKNGANAPAIADLQRAYALNPKRFSTSVNLGIAFLSAKQNKQALRHLNEALQKLPRDYTVNRLLGRLYFEQNQTGVAKGHYQKAQQASRKLGSSAQAVVEIEYGVLMAKSGELDKAVALLESATRYSAGDKKLEPLAQANYAIALLDRGYRRLTKNQGAKALGDLSRAEGLSRYLSADQKLLLRFLLAMSYLDAGNWGKAGKMFRELTGTGSLAKLLKPPFDRLGAQYFTTYTAYRQGNFDFAARALRRMMRKAPRAIRNRLGEIIRSCHEMEALAALRRGNPKKATRAYRDAKNYGMSPSGKHNQAVALYNSGRKAQALRLWTAGGMPARALCNAGTHYDNAGAPRKALDHYQRCQAQGGANKSVRDRIRDLKKIFGW